jgi:hypothetical protein
MAQRLSEHFVHLGLGATCVPQPPFDGMAWYEGYGEVVRETIREGEYVIDASGVWHTAELEPGVVETALFVTAGEGTEHRPL